MNDLDIVQQVQAQWNSAGKPWNPGAFTDCFTADALFFGGRPAHCVGREAIRGYFDSYVGIIEECQLKLREQHTVATGEGFLLAQGWGEFSFVLAGGQRTGSTVRTTWLLQRLPQAGWKIRQQHFAPAPPEPPLGR